jgi:hypothetical protein
MKDIIHFVSRETQDLQDLRKSISDMESIGKSLITDNNNTIISINNLCDDSRKINDDHRQEIEESCILMEEAIHEKTRAKTE